MLNDFLIVNKEVLPPVFEKVVEVKAMMEHGECAQVSEAVKKVGISRSAYYKYKDHVFVASRQSKERKAVFTFLLSHEKGILSEVLNLFSYHHCNVLTLSQSIPIHNNASVSMSVDVSEMDITVQEMLQEASKLKGVSKMALVSLE